LIAAEDSFAQMIGFDLHWRLKKGSKKKLSTLINDHSGVGLPPEEEIVREQARFLSNLILSIRGLRFYKLDSVR